MLGSGGMGSVYRARDQRLGRPVAVKVLGSRPDTPNAMARLRREAEAASSLNHPSIVTIYDIGEALASGLFIAMELIDGVNLREWLREPRSKKQKLEILLQIAGGLAAAHARGIVHRDVKPENIMVTRTGFGKLVDFGLAKVIEPVVPDDDKPTDVRLTARGHVVGTIAYMSPEQLRGEPLDARSDIYSFGCVLRDAFEGDAEVARVIERCTQQDRALRYQSMDAVILDLDRPRRRFPLLAVSAAALLLVITAAVIFFARSRSSPPVPVAVQQASIAVLPFRMLGASSDAYVADGLTDSLTTDLGKHSDVTVIDRNASRRYSSDVDLRKAGEELHVNHVLLGSVQRFGDNLRIDARLVSPGTQAVVWSEHYDRPLSQIFSAEQEIVRVVASNLAPRAASRPVTQPSDPRVADLYLRGRFFAEDPDWSVEGRSIPLFEEVLRLDPVFLPARIALAYQYQREAFRRDPDRQWEEKSFVELQKILAQDPNCATAYAIRGQLRWNLAHGFAHEEALADFNRAIHLDPNTVNALQARGSLFLHIGLLDEALNDFRRALHLDPFNDFASYRIARVHLYQQKCDQSAAELERKWPRDFQVAIALDCAGDPDAALATALRIAAAPTVSPRTSSSTDRAGNVADISSVLAVLYAKRGQRQQAEEAIRKALAGEGSSHFHHAMYYIAAAYAQMHDADKALHWLERTAREGMPCYPLFASDPLLNPIRSDPRMQKFLDGQRRDWEERRRQNPS